MKKSISLLLCLLLSLSMLAGCNPEEEVESGPVTFNVTVTNASGYIFNELYVSATAANSWGSDHLGSTSVLKNNGSFTITLDQYEFNNFDIKVIDEDGDTYVFTRVPLEEGTEVAITLSTDLTATVTALDGSQTTVLGELNGGTGGESDPVDVVDTTQSFTFTLYNESVYDVYAVYMMPAYTDGEGVDILPSVLEAGQSYEFSATPDGPDYEGVTEWVLRVVDVDGDESSSYDVFNPWLLSYVDITWDTATGGYICTFMY